MPHFTAQTTFRDGYDTFEEGQEYEAPAERCAIFCSNGWASSDADTGYRAPIDLDPTVTPDDTTISAKSSSPAARKKG